MERDPSKSHKDQSEHYLNTIGPGYILDESSGLYKTKSAHRQNHSDQTEAGSQKRTPFFVHALRDWVTVALSTLTLFGLGATVYFTRQQWRTMNQTYCEIRKQTSAVKEQATAATNSVQNAERFFRADERAWIEIGHENDGLR